MFIEFARYICFVYNIYVRRKQFFINNLHRVLDDIITSAASIRFRHERSMLVYVYNKGSMYICNGLS